MKKKLGNPRVEKRERKSQDKNVIEGMVDEIGKAGNKGISRIISEGSEPFGEGTNIGTEEGVDSVSESVEGAESAMGDRRESHP